MKNMSYAEQEKLFNESIEWMRKEIGIVPTEFVPGWWSYNKDTLRLCKRFRLKMVNSFDYDYTHDYHWVLWFPVILDLVIINPIKYVDLDIIVAIQAPRTASFIPISNPYFMNMKFNATFRMVDRTKSFAMIEGFLI